MTYGVKYISDGLRPKRRSAWGANGAPNCLLIRQFWEIVIKTQKGLLSITDLATWWRRATELTAARMLNIRASHITALAALPMLHKDPFDRILIAQAKAEGLPLVTDDSPIGEYPIETLW
jgi:PIN domain nuclease of toxin-antitoxin system